MRELTVKNLLNLLLHGSQTVAGTARVSHPVPEYNWQVSWKLVYQERWGSECPVKQREGQKLAKHGCNPWNEIYMESLMACSEPC